MPDPVYATRAQLALYGLGPHALTRATTDQQDAALAGGSREGDGYLQKRFTLPITGWKDDLSKAVCKLAAWDLISTVVGYPADDPAGTNAKMRRDEAIAWFLGVADDDIAPLGIIDSSSTSLSEPTTVAFASDPQRGWGRRW